MSRATQIRSSSGLTRSGGLTYHRFRADNQSYRYAPERPRYRRLAVARLAWRRARAAGRAIARRRGAARSRSGERPSRRPRRSSRTRISRPFRRRAPHACDADRRLRPTPGGHLAAPEAAAKADSAKETRGRRSRRKTRPTGRAARRICRRSSARNETFAVALQSRINALANEYTNEGDGVRQAGYRD